jgi:eukaryotic-like serine/threonine-protein kinase
MAEPKGKSGPRIVGRYELYGEIAHGGMATVHVGRIVSDAGFSRTVAIKRLHPQCARDPYFASMFVDEARLASRIHHPNVVSTLDVVVADDELFVVMEYVQGESLAPLIRATLARGELVPVDFVSAIGIGVLDGLHATHEAVSELDEPLGIVHRDVSPQNILIGIDGVPRLIDFGVAKAVGRVQTTREGQLKGKLSYMPPEQFEGAPADRRGDIYATSIVLWETLAGRRLFEAKNEAETLRSILRGPTHAPSHYAPLVPHALDEIVMCGLATDPGQRFPTARDMALAIEGVVAPAAARRVGEWVRAMAAPSLGERAKRIFEIESTASSGVNVASFLDAEGAEGRRRRSHPDVESSVRKATLAVATPAQPLVRAGPPAALVPPIPPALPASGPELGAPSSRPPIAQPLAPPKSAPPPALLGTALPAGMGWTERWYGEVWTAVYRPVSLTIIGLCGAVVLGLAALILSQPATFGTVGPIAVGVGILISAILLARVARATHYRIDASIVAIEQKPGGSSMSVAAFKINKFLVMDLGPNGDPLDFSVHFLPFEGDAQRVDVSYASNAEARFAAHRLTDMLWEMKSRPSRNLRA